MIAGIEHASMFFNIVFFITILSLLIQGTTVTQAAKWLDMVDEPERKDEFGIELPEEIKERNERDRYYPGGIIPWK